MVKNTQELLEAVFNTSPALLPLKSAERRKKNSVIKP